jgi:hypothetical protein
MKKIIVYFLMIFACKSLLSGKEDTKYYAEFFISKETLKYFSNKEKAKEEIKSIILNCYNQVWEIFENNKEKICDEEIRATIELFGLKLLTHDKKMEIDFELDKSYIEYHKAKREPGFFTIQKLKNEAQDVNGESDNRVDLQDENERKIAIIRILNGLGDCTMKHLKYVNPRTDCEYEHMLTHSECFRKVSKHTLLSPGSGIIMKINGEQRDQVNYKMVVICLNIKSPEARMTKTGTITKIVASGKSKNTHIP